MNAIPPKALASLRRREVDYIGIIHAASAASGIPAQDITSPCRIQRVCDARAIAAFEMLRAGMSLPAVGHALGGRHHSTVINARRTYFALYDTCPIFRAQAQACREAVECLANLKNEAP